jgi:hypothetical protein
LQQNIENSKLISNIWYIQKQKWMPVITDGHFLQNYLHKILQQYFKIMYFIQQNNIVNFVWTWWPFNSGSLCLWRVSSNKSCLSLSHVWVWVYSYKPTGQWWQQYEVLFTPLSITSDSNHEDWHNPYCYIFHASHWKQSKYLKLHSNLSTSMGNSFIFGWQIVIKPTAYQYCLLRTKFTL